MSGPDPRLARLADEWAIRDTLCRYWRGIDRRDPALVASTYHPGAYDDHGYFRGPVEDFVETLAPGVWAHFTGTMHFSGHVAVELDPASPDRARAESYAEAHHLRCEEDGRGSDLVYGLRYVDRFERRDGEWRIAHRVCTWDWSRLDRFAPIPLDAGYARGLHEGKDPVHAQPAGLGRPAEAGALLAKQACLDTLTRYTRGVDRCDPERVRSAYHPDAYDDHGGYQGDVEGFLAWVRPTVFESFDCTMHQLGNCLIEPDPERPGERAWAETYAVAHHVTSRGAESTDLIMGVRYLDRLEDRGEGWRIADRRMTFEWERVVSVGDQTPLPGFRVGRRDGTDPVLERPVAVAVPASIGVAADRAEILGVLLRYCRGVDRRDRELIRSAYHADAHDDHGVYQGGLEGFLDFVETEVWARLRITMHRLGQSLIEIEGDEAWAETPAVCHHVTSEAGRDVSDGVNGIRYLDRFERRDGVWRIARRELRWEWVRTDALEPLPEGWTAGVAGREDPACRMAEEA